MYIVGELLVSLEYLGSEYLSIQFMHRKSQKRIRYTVNVKVKIETKCENVLFRFIIPLKFILYVCTF